MKIKEGTVLGMDVSTKTLGCSLFAHDGALIELKYLTPKVKKDTDSTDALFDKADQFRDFIKETIKADPTTWGEIDRVFIEEPLLSSNNVYTVTTLVRFNGMISKIIHDILKVKPKYISTYESRKNAFPELMGMNKHGKKVLFGGYPKDVDKKMIVWDLVCKREPQVIWPLTKHSTPIKECFDLSDAYAVAYGAMRKQNLWA